MQRKRVPVHKPTAGVVVLTMGRPIANPFRLTVLSVTMIVVEFGISAVSIPSTRRAAALLNSDAHQPKCVTHRSALSLNGSLWVRAQGSLMKCYGVVRVLIRQANPVGIGTRHKKQEVAHLRSTCNRSHCASTAEHEEPRCKGQTTLCTGLTDFKIIPRSYQAFQSPPLPVWHDACADQIVSKTISCANKVAGAAVPAHKRTSASPNVSNRQE